MGVDAFKASEVTLRFRIKTVPMKQWDVGRELRRRDQEGVRRAAASRFLAAAARHDGSDHVEPDPRSRSPIQALPPQYSCHRFATVLPQARHGDSVSVGMKRLLWIWLSACWSPPASPITCAWMCRRRRLELTFDAVSRGDVVATVEATGTLQPLDTVQVGTQVSGTIASLGTDFNQLVKRGQVLATLDQAISDADRSGQGDRDPAAVRRRARDRCSSRTRCSS